MKDNALKTFIQKTYTASSPIPYIITIQIGVFILSHIFSIIGSQANTDIYTLIISKLSLPNTIEQWLVQPWSIISYSFVYSNLFQLIFDTLWLYWTGTIFLNLLQPRQLSFILAASVIIGGVLFLLISSLTPLATSTLPFTSITFGLAALLGTLLILVPNSEVRLFFFGNVKLKIIASVYFAFEIFHFIYNNQIAATIAFLFAILFGIFFIQSLNKGNDWSTMFNKKKKRHLKLVHRREGNFDYSNDNPSQEMIDHVLDKISEKGYDSLSIQEKELLFKASKKN